VFICTGTHGEAGDAGPRGDDPVRAAVAVELIHMATLVHDDVVDGALLRRGRPTVFATSGREAATATGDFLFSRALSLLVENGSADQVATLSGACLSLARGELAQREDAHDVNVTIERYMRRCELKTGRLFSAACALGALAGGRSAHEAAALSSYGLALGIAFQLLDDVLDVSGSPERTGKRRGTDLLDGTVTLPLVLARERDPQLAQVDLRAVATQEQAEELCLRMVATGALDETRARARSLVEKAKGELRGAVPLDLERRLAAVAERVADRYS
jgi:geranylgeranyl pyrophosphate synthase